MAAHGSSASRSSRARRSTAMIKDGVDETSVEGVRRIALLKSIAEQAGRSPRPRPGGPGPVVALGGAHATPRSSWRAWWTSWRTRPARTRSPTAAELLAGHPRHRARAGPRGATRPAGASPPEGRGRGLAVHESFGSIVAQVAEVSVEGSKIRVHRVTAAVDCGTCVNPEAVRAQMRRRRSASA